MPRSQISTVPAPYSPGGDLALEVRVLERVVLDVHGEVALAAARAGFPSARPSSRARRRARAGSRSAAAARRAAGRRSAAAPPALRACRTAPASAPDRVFAGTRRGSPVDCRPKRNAFFTKRLQIGLFPAQTDFGPGISLWKVWRPRQSLSGSRERRGVGTLGRDARTPIARYFARRWRAALVGIERRRAPRVPRRIAVLAEAARRAS